MVRVVSWEGKVALQSTIYNITERKQAVERLAVRVKQMETVRAVSIDITRELDLTTLLRLIIQRAVELVRRCRRRGGFSLGRNQSTLDSANLAWRWGVDPEGPFATRGRFNRQSGATTHRHARASLPTLALSPSPDLHPILVPWLYWPSRCYIVGSYSASLLSAMRAPDSSLLRQIMNSSDCSRRKRLLLLKTPGLFQAVQDQASQLTQANTALHTEVAERRRAETALRESEERYRAFVAHSSEGIWRFEFATPMPITLPKTSKLRRFMRRCYLAECNDVMARMYGFTSADDIVGVRLDALLVRSDPDNLTFLRNFIRSGYRLVDAESHEVDRQGNTKIFLNTFVGIVENGLLVHTWGNQRDITERKRLEERLLQTQKMAAIGTLAGGIAHDFNNILAAILGYTELAMDDMSPQHPQHGYLQEVLTAGKRARDLVQQILTFSRQTKHQRHPVHLHQLIKETLVMLRASLPATITIQQHLDEQIGPVMVDTTQMHQVLMNLCTNAEYAMRETGGLLDVRLEAITLGPNATALHPDLHPGRYVRIVVHDSGHGITLEVQERIFEPFFTTKDVGEGTGMGLAVAHGIVANHGGVITVESSPGHGTTFAVYLPYTTPVVPPSQQPADTTPAWPGMHTARRR